MEEILSFGGWLQERRKVLDLTRPELARVAGCSVAALRKIEADERKPSKALAERLADYLSLDPQTRPHFLLAARGQLSPAYLPPPHPHLAISSPISAKTPDPGTNLPSPTTRLVGREAEVATASALLTRPDVRLVTLIGPPGVGKTRLALEVAHDFQDTLNFEDGVWFVPLAPIRDPELVLSAISRIVDVRASGNRPLLELLQDLLRAKRMLLVLDNFEQVVSSAPNVGELLAAAPGLKVLVTSREVLHLYGEHEFTVPSLALPNVKHSPELEQVSQSPAVRLFVERVHAVQPHFQLTNENAHAVGEICVRLDGLALAIELAAARIKLFPPQRMLEQLKSRSQFLVSEARDLPARQRTLRGAIAWSYDLLDGGEQRLFRRLSVFVGGFTLEAAQAVASADLEPSMEVFRGLVSLMDKSLVGELESVAANPRFTMLETIREYGVEQLEANAEAAAIHRQHATFYLALVEGANVELSGPSAEFWLRQLEEEYGNLRAALKWAFGSGDADVGIRLALALAGPSWQVARFWQGFWGVHDYISEGQKWLKQVGRSSEAAPAVQAIALLGAGWFASQQGDQAQANALLTESLSRHRALGDTLGMARVLTELGRIVWVQGEYARANALLTESLSRLRKLGDREAVAMALVWLAACVRDQGNHVRAHALFEESLALWRELDDKVGLVLAINGLGDLYSYEGDYARAAAYQDALVLSRATGDRDTTAIILCNLGRVAHAQGDDTRARSFLEESVTLLRKHIQPWALTWVLQELGYVVHAQGDPAQGRALLREGLRLQQRTGEKWYLSQSLERCAGLEVKQGLPVRAARLFGAAEAYRDAIGRPLYTGERVDYDRDMASARALLDAAAFAAAWDQGQKMTLNEAIDYALEES